MIMVLFIEETISLKPYNQEQKIQRIGRRRSLIEELLRRTMFICFFNCVLLFSCFCNFLIFNCNINEKNILHQLFLIVTLISVIVIDIYFTSFIIVDVNI